MEQRNKEEELKATIGLSMVKGLGSINLKELIAYASGASNVAYLSKERLKNIPRIGEKTIASLKSAQHQKQIKNELAFINQYKVESLLYHDKAYPSRLKHCADGPAILYYKGKQVLNQEKAIAIVGTRTATDYGKQWVKQFLKDISPFKPLIISGLAYGIDATAHKAALANSLPTVGVLGHSLNTIYPAAHNSLAKDMIKTGGLITEFNTQQPVVPTNFPKRNRIIAGMADAVIVVESKITGGAIITANIASSYNRDVFAVPGRTNDHKSTGCNFLIKTFKAALINDSADFINQMVWDLETIEKPKQRSLPLDLNKQELEIVNLLKQHKMLEVDGIFGAINKSSSQIAATLLELELKGIVICSPGKKYSLS